MKKSFKIIIAVVFLIFGAVIFSVNVRAEFGKTNSTANSTVKFFRIKKTLRLKHYI